MTFAREGAKTCGLGKSSKEASVWQIYAIRINNEDELNKILLLVCPYC